ncbi:MAG: shikimate dehydrogenase [Flavobacteriaceae bacterium]|jgi:shikimate dehydrogenase
MKHYGLIGRSLKHSFSQSFFTGYFAAKSIEGKYHLIEIESLDELADTLSGKYEGINVTIPYKEEIIPFLDSLTEEAKAIGAVNVVEFLDGKKIGHNTDAFGFHQSIKPFLTNRHERALIFGTGGASKAVEFVLKSLGLDVIFISRTPQKENHFGYDEVNDLMIDACKLIVNTTPVGTFPDIDASIDLPFQALTEEHLVIDLIYNPAKTKFLEKSENAGATILNGETMLKQQALKSWEIWSKDV